MSINGSIKLGTNALVIGATTKTGRKIARSLAQNGVRVIATGHDLDAAWEPVLNYPGSCAFACNLLSEASCHKLAQSIEARYGHLDAIIDASNLLYESDTVHRVPLGRRSPGIINLGASFGLIRECLPALIETRGQLIQIASAAVSSSDARTPLKVICHDALHLAKCLNTGGGAIIEAPFFQSENQGERQHERFQVILPRDATCSLFTSA